MQEGLELAEVPRFPNYFIRSDGKAFFVNGKEKIISCKKGRSAKLIIRVNYEMYTLGFATLIAQAFLPNPWGYKHVIFKNRNYHHCHKNNIAWVDAETYNLYCTLGKRSSKGRPKIYIAGEEAIQLCTDENLKNYYTTLEEHWVHIAWQQVDERLSKLRYWREVKSETYLYFLDRVKRFSILGTPSSLMYIYAKWQHINGQKTISPYIPVKTILQLDESLHHLNHR